MARVIFILGLAGAGKSTLADRMNANGLYFVIDGEFDPDLNQAQFDQKYAALVGSLRQGIHAIVIEISLGDEAKRQRLTRTLERDVPDVAFEWKCFVNDPARAAVNVRKRPCRDPEAHVELNEEVSRWFTCPEGAEILPIET
jgi:hypothetical protein